MGRNCRKKVSTACFLRLSTEKRRLVHPIDDLRGKLVAKGVPKEEIAFIHEADTEQKKKDLFTKAMKRSSACIDWFNGKDGSRNERAG